MTQYSIDADLNQDPAIFGSNSGFVASDGWGTAQNGPVSTSCQWSLRVNMNDIGHAPHDIWPGTMTYENDDGRWVRRFSRDYTDGSTSYGPWVPVFGVGFVQSVNSATGVVSITVSGT